MEWRSLFLDILILLFESNTGIIYIQSESFLDEHALAQVRNPIDDSSSDPTTSTSGLSQNRGLSKTCNDKIAAVNTLDCCHTEVLSLGDTAGPSTDATGGVLD